MGEEQHWSQDGERIIRNTLRKIIKNYYYLLLYRPRTQVWRAVEYSGLLWKICVPGASLLETQLLRRICTPAAWSISRHHAIGMFRDPLLIQARAASMSMTQCRVVLQFPMPDRFAGNSIQKVREVSLQYPIRFSAGMQDENFFNFPGDHRPAITAIYKHYVVLKV